MRNLIALLVVVAILTAGFWPGQPAPRNRAAISDTGLHFIPPSQAITGQGSWASKTSITIELWVTRDIPTAAGNLEIVGFWDRTSTPVLILGQWPKGLYLHNRDDNPEALPSKDHYVTVSSDDTKAHIAVIGDSEGIHLMVDGEPLPMLVPARANRPLTRIEGQLLLGSPGNESSGFVGTIHAVAVHARALSASKLREHATMPLDMVSELSASPNLLALYRFSRDESQPIVVYPPVAPKMRIPKRVSSPMPQLLRFDLTPRWELSGMAVDLAINILGFAPLGMVIAWRRRQRHILAAGLVAFAISLTIEVCQFWIAGRDSSAIDLCSNTIGAMVGALCLVTATARSSRSTT